MGRRRQQVTIRHVAADAGVSLQTVSRVINREPNVRPEMERRVQSSIDKLGYVPSIAAQRLSGSRSYLIVALNDRDRTIADWRERQGTDWVDQMLLGGMLKAAEFGYRMMFELVDTHDDHIERELRATIAALQPDGIILTPPHSENPRICRVLEEAGIAFARIGSIAPGPGIAMTMDDDRAAALATRHLAELGHRSIGFIAGSREYSLSQWRVQGWQAEMGRLGLSTAGLLEEGDFSYESGIKAARRLLERPAPVTAIIASNDRMALASMATARELGREVPRDVSIISFDNTPIVNFSEPSLTAVDQPVAATASKAIEMIIGQLRGEQPPQEPIVVEAGLVVRNSTAAPLGV
jgi:LacI family transcriptional regulator